MIGAINRTNCPSATSWVAVAIVRCRTSESRIVSPVGVRDLVFVLALIGDFGTNRVLQIRCITSLVSQDSSIHTLSWRPLVFDGSPLVKCKACLRFSSTITTLGAWDISCSLVPLLTWVKFRFMNVAETRHHLKARAKVSLNYVFSCLRMGRGCFLSGSPLATYSPTSIGGVAALPSFLFLRGACDVALPRGTSRSDSRGGIGGGVGGGECFLVLPMELATMEMVWATTMVGKARGKEEGGRPEGGRREAATASAKSKDYIHHCERRRRSVTRSLARVGQRGAAAAAIRPTRETPRTNAPSLLCSRRLLVVVVVVVRACI